MADRLARWLRANATDAERILWSVLRGFKREGMHFRRQAPVGRYIVDFVCHHAKIVVELDGSQHGGAIALEYDQERTAFLNSRGYCVVRFPNYEVLRNRDYVIDAIGRFAAASPHPKRAARASTSPQGGGNT